MENKILLFSTEFPPTCGGAGRVAERNASFLSSSGKKVDVLTRDIGNIEVNRNYNIIKVKYVSKIFPIYFAKKIKELKNEEYNHIILNDVGAALTASFFFDKEQIKKSICYFHGSEIDNIVIKPKLYYKFINFEKKYHELLHNCKNIICVSDYLRKLVISTFQDIDREKIKKIQTGSDLKDFYPDKINLYEKYQISRDTKIIFSASRIVERKGYKSLFNIFKRLRLSGKKYFWFIAGSGEYESELSSLIVKSGLNNDVKFLGNLTSSDLRKYYSSADIFVLLSHFDEAYGLVYLESLLCGTPVIGNNVGGVGEVIKNKENGFLVSNDEECFEILNNNLYESISQEAIKQSLSDFSIDKQSLLTICS